jgi:hypothetical protein
MRVSWIERKRMKRMRVGDGISVDYISALVLLPKMLSGLFAVDI